MDYLNSIMKSIDENSVQMVQMLQELIRIKSTAGEPEGEMPFGAGVHKAFLYVLEKGKEAGFRTADADHYGGHVEIQGESGKIMGIAGHLDVVPEGTGWEEDPYGGIVKEGRIYGRGAADDKGPVTAAFFAMKAVKESGVPVRDTVRLILGLDEETDWKGMRYYLSKTEQPDYGFTPDGDFPVIHGEKGILVFSLAKKLGKTLEKGMELRSLTGGEAANMVPDYARAVIRDSAGGGYSRIRKMAEEFQKEKQVQIRCKGAGKSLEITAEGISAHGANPQEGLNAISLLMEFLGKITFTNEDVNDFVEFYNAYIGFETDGSALGCCFQDEVSGKTVLNAGKIVMNSQAAALTLNVRYPVTLQEEAVYDGIREAAERFNLGIIKEKHEKPVYLPAEDPMVKTLMDIYQRQTGDRDSSPLVIGGGTYARAMEHVLAFGGRFPGEPELAHRKNEFVSVESLVKMAKIYGEAIYRLACSPEAERL